jgi:hypothetical protein
VAQQGKKFAKLLHHENFCGFCWGAFAAFGIFDLAREMAQCFLVFGLLANGYDW